MYLFVYVFMHLCICTAQLDAVEEWTYEQSDGAAIGADAYTAKAHMLKSLMYPAEHRREISAAADIITGMTASVHKSRSGCVY